MKKIVVTLENEKPEAYIPSEQLKKYLHSQIQQAYDSGEDINAIDVLSWIDKFVSDAEAM